MSKFWDDEAHVARLLRLRAEKITPREIGTILGISRNAVISKLNRIDGVIHKRKPIPEPEPSPSVPTSLSPAMRHLAKFDSILAAIIKREGGV